MLVFPNITVPACLKFLTTVASYGETKLYKILDPHVVSTPSEQKISFCAIGIPVSGPALPSEICWSAAFAAAKACSSVIVIKLFNCLSNCLMRSRKYFVSSVLEILRAANSFDNSAMVLCVMRIPVIQHLLLLELNINRLPLLER